MMQEVRQETIDAGLKIAPAVGGVAWSYFTLNEVVAVVTLCYVLLQIVLLIPKVIDLFRKKKEDV